jgi:hypothetical protein
MRQARLAAILACGFLATSALAEPLDGVNNVHLGWLKPAERDAVIDDMVKAGVLTQISSPPPRRPPGAVWPSNWL